MRRGSEPSLRWAGPKRLRRALGLGFGVPWVGCGDAAQRAMPSVAGSVFGAIAPETGSAHTHREPLLDSKRSNILPRMASADAAASAGDYGLDDRIDLDVPDSRKSEPKDLYRNKGGGSFSDLAEAARGARPNTGNRTRMNADGRARWGCRPDLYAMRLGSGRLFGWPTRAASGKEEQYPEPRCKHPNVLQPRDSHPADAICDGM